MNDPYDQIFVARQSLIHMVVLLLLLFAAGCSSMDQIEYDTEHESLSLQAGDLAAGGIGFLTPAAATRMANTSRRQWINWTPGTGLHNNNLFAQLHQNYTK